MRDTGTMRMAGRRAVAGLLTLSMATMAMPTAAFAVNTPGNTWDVDAQASGHGDSEQVTHNDDLATDNNGARAVSEQGGHAYAGVIGDLDAGGEGLWAHSEDADSYSDAWASGDVSTGSDGATATAYDGGRATAEVDGDLTAGGTHGVYAEAEGTGSQATVNVGTDDGGGKVTSQQGVHVSASDGATASAKTGDIVVNGEDTGEGAGANNVSASNGGTASLVAGDITSTCSGLTLGANIDDFLSQEVFSTVYAEVGKIDAAGVGISVVTNGSIAAVTTDGVSSGSTGVLSVQLDDGLAAVQSNGDIVTSGEKPAVSFVNIDGGTGMLAVDGDLTSAGGCGLNLFHASDDCSFAGLVTGTISGAEGGLVNNSPSKKNIALIVWQIKSGAGADTIISGDDDQGTLANSVGYIIRVAQPERGGTIKATKADGSDLDRYNPFALADDELFDVAHEGDKVLLKVDLQEGYRIVGAYNGDDEKANLLFDGTDYYVMVERGGGIYLSVELSNEYAVKFVNDDGKTVLQSDLLAYGATPEYRGKAPTKPDTKQYTYVFTGWEPKIDPVTKDVTYVAAYNAVTRSYDLTFDLAGGTLDGQTGSVVKQAEWGSTVSILGAPTRDGYRFLYWKGSNYKPGDQYKVDGAHTFTAVWEKVGEENKKEENGEKKSDGSSKNGSTDDKKGIKVVSKASAQSAKSSSGALPQTGDESGGPVAAVLATAGIACVAGGLRRRDDGDDE